MATPAQAAAATVGAGSLAAAGAYGITQAVKGNEESTEETGDSLDKPTTIDVFSITDIAKEPYTGKLITFFKESNLEHLVKPTSNNAEAWWKWAFENKFQKNKQTNQLDDLFSKVQQPYSTTQSETTDLTSLNQACNKAYQQDKAKYKFEETDYLLQNISAFCTSDDTPFDISEPKAEVHTSKPQDTNYKDGVLSISNNFSLLVKKEGGTSNDLWWKWAYKNLYKKTTENIDNTFSSTAVTLDFHDQTTTALNHVCDAAYKKTYSDLKASDNKLLKNIKQFCSTNRTTDLLKLPEPTNPTKVTTAGASGMIKENNNLNKLVDADNANNHDWWDWMFENVYPSDPTQRSQLENPFKHVTTARGTADATNDTVTSLNKACKYAYTNKQKASFDNSKLLEQVKKFCSPYSSAENLEAPKT